MHKNNFVVVLKYNGKVLREHDGEIQLPFGSEYSIYIKNLDSRDAVVKIHIDGEDVTGNRIIVRANDTAELKGHKNNGNVRTKFKFIEKTQKISDYRGDKIDDGIIRVEVTFEKKINYEYTYKKTYWDWPSYPWYPYIWYNYSNIEPIDGVKYYNNCSAIDSRGTGCLGSTDCKQTCHNFNNTDGITIKGSDTKQDFSWGYVGDLEDNSTVITIRLKGYKDKEKVERPIVVREKLSCDICGIKNNSTHKFCKECGARL